LIIEKNVDLHKISLHQINIHN